MDNCSAFSAVRVSSNFAALSNVQCPLQKAQFQIRFEKSRCCNIAVDCKCELGRTSFCAFVAVLTSDLALQIGCANASLKWVLERRGGGGGQRKRPSTYICKEIHFFAFQPGNTCVFVGEPKKGCQIFLTNSQMLQNCLKIQQNTKSWQLFIKYS